jgi:hypothetical protein
VKTLLTPRETEQAVYIDFEALATAPRVIGLLGVAFRGDGDDVAIRQFVVDGVLREAVKSRPTCEGASLEDAVRAVVETATALDGPIVSWSNHDRDLILNHAEVSDALKAQVSLRHRNAISTATRWLSTFHPGVRFDRLRFGGKNQLARFVPLAGYQVPRHLSKGSAAMWLRHIRDQLEKHGQLRDVTARAKRHWSMLLDYNRHDCLGLRAVTTRAARENALWYAYERTVYRAQTDCGDIEIRVGSPNRRFVRRVLEPANARSWAFITASNPDSRPLSESENATRHQVFRAAISRLGLTAFGGRGVPPDGTWPSERSLLILDVTRSRAISLGRKFGQVCIVFGQTGGKAELVLTNQRRPNSD